MKKLFFLFSIFAIVLSCSSDETSTPVAPPPAPIVKYTITISAGEGGTVSTTGGEYEAGQTVSVTATPQGEYVFTGWSDGNTNATRTITIGSNSTLTANFEKRKYPLTVNFEGEGEVIEEIINSGRTTEYDSGTTVKLTAQAAAEWVFVGWTGDIESTEESVQIVIGEPKEVTANFEKKKYPLTVNIEGEGEVIEEIIEAGRTTDYDSGTTVKLTAEPEGEWLFTGWSGDIGDIDPTENPIQLNIIESKTVTATFEKKKYPLTVNIEGEGEVLEEIVNAGRTTDYDSGTTVKLTAVPEEGWEFVGWTGAIESEELEVQLLVTEAKEVNAEFKELEIVSISIEDPKETLIVSHKFSPIVYANYTNGEKLDISSNVKISTVNKKTTILSDNTIIGAIKGDEKLIFDYKEQSTSLDIYINNIEFEELDSKFLEVKESTIKVPFLMINVFPTNDGIIHNDTIGPSSYWEIKNPSLEDSKSKIKNILLTSKNAIELGTAFRDYGENQVKPYVSMLPLAYINIYVSNENEYKTKKTWNNKQTYDYIKMFSDLEIENYVNIEGLKEIWITDFPYGGFPSLTNSGLYNEINDTWLPESNMSSPSTGDVSNSYRIPDDLPLYNNTYVVYGNSGHRGVDTNIHNRGHQIESQLRFIEKNKKSGQELFWNKFVGVDESGNQAMNKRSGNTHFPPNAKSDYDYCNENQIESDIFNWTPDGGDIQQVKCGSWRNLSLNFTYNKYSDDGIININNDPQTKWLITWFQSIPGENNNIPYSIDGRNYKLTNWWDLFYNWDNAINQNKTLWTSESNQESNIYVDKNGITIKAEAWAEVGDKGIINGVEYTIVDEATLRQMVANDEDVTKVVTSKISNFENLFYNKTLFNQNIVSWDTSNVTNMNRLFSESAFNQPIGSWNVSNVTTMWDTFYGTSFNQDISNWDVSNVRVMQGTFAYSSFNQDINNWDVSNVTWMYLMFWESEFNKSLNDWDVGNVTNMEGMFLGASFFNQNINDWDVSNVTNMRMMFQQASSFNQDIGDWNVSNVTTMKKMFWNAKSFNHNIGDWNVINVTDMSEMFLGANSFNQDIGNWDVINVTNMEYMFQNAFSFNQDLTGWCVANIIEKPLLFDSNASSWNSQRPIWGTCPEPLLYIDDNGITVKASSLANVGDIGILNGIEYEVVDKSTLKTMLRNKQNVSYVVTSKINDMSFLLSNVDVNGDITSWDVSNVTDMEYMFENAFSFNQNIGSWDVSNVTDMEYMFQNATSFNQNIGNWDVSNVKSTISMFQNAISFNQPIGGWNTSSVVQMRAMFDGASSFNQPIDTWDTSSVTRMNNMFQNATSFNQPLNNWDVSSVSQMEFMFFNAEKFNQPLNNWDVSNVTNMRNMFFNAKKFNQPLNNWDVSNVLNMDSMFWRALNFNQNLKNWNVNSVRDCDFFSSFSPLQSTYLPNFTNCTP